MKTYLLCLYKQNHNVLWIYFSDGEINELPMILNEPCSEEGTLLHLATMVS